MIDVYAQLSVDVASEFSLEDHVAVKIINYLANEGVLEYEVLKGYYGMRQESSN